MKKRKAKGKSDPPPVPVVTSDLIVLVADGPAQHDQAGVSHHHVHASRVREH